MQQTTSPLRLVLTWMRSTTPSTATPTSTSVSLRTRLLSFSPARLALFVTFNGVMHARHPLFFFHPPCYFNRIILLWTVPLYWDSLCYLTPLPSASAWRTSSVLSLLLPRTFSARSVGGYYLRENNVCFSFIITLGFSVKFLKQPNFYR